MTRKPLGSIDDIGVLKKKILFSCLLKMQFSSLLSKLYNDYIRKTSTRLKILDAYLVYILLTGIVQFIYCCVIGTFPFNSFLAGFISCVGSFVLAVALRIQSNPENKLQFPYVSPERAFADFIFANTILHLVVINFLG